MERGNLVINAPFTQERGAFRYEYQAVGQPGSKPSSINYSVFKNDKKVAGGSARPQSQNTGFYFQVESNLTDEERNTIYSQISEDINGVSELAEKIKIQN